MLHFWILCLCFLSLLGCIPFAGPEQGTQSSPRQAPLGTPIGVEDIERLGISIVGGPITEGSRYHGFDRAIPEKLAVLTGAYADKGYDSDGDGLYNSLALSVGVEVSQPHAYYLLGWLEDTNSHEIAWAGTIITLTPGSYAVPLLFDSIWLREHIADGPYRLTAVELQATGGRHSALLDTQTQSHQTAAYRAVDFDPRAVTLTGQFSDRGVDTNGDGYFERLDIDIGLDVDVPGSYDISGQFNEHFSGGSKNVVLSQGFQTVTLSFDVGRIIYQNRLAGPYDFMAVKVYDAQSQEVHGIYQAHTTAPYRYDQFQPIAAATLQRDSFSDKAEDLDGDGDYDTLAISFRTEVDRPGTYGLSATIWVWEDKERRSASGILAEERVELTAGVNEVRLAFQGSSLFEYRLDGPYTINDVELRSEEGYFIMEAKDVYQTGPYQYTMFSPPE
jgi:hypothetical protein